MNNSWVQHSGGRLRHQGYIFRIRVNEPAFDAEIKKLSGNISSASVSKVPPENATETSREIFIVHGRNDGVKQKVARLLEQLNLKPIILHELPNSGRTIIEKFEDHSKVGFAVVLLTDDDTGGLTGSATMQPRARQNVVLEHGYFLGRLGRKNVCALYVEGVDLPSDLAGVLYVPFDDKDAWKYKLGKELRAAGIDVDLNNIV